MTRRIAAILFLCALVTGCKQSETVTAVRPAQTSAVNAETDTLQVPAMPPVPERGVPTEPITLRVYTDTLPAPTLDVRRVTVDRDPPPGFAKILYRVGDSARMETAPVPPPGEIWDWIADSDTTVRRQIRGDPEPDTVEVLRPTDEPGWWERQKRRTKNAFALIGLVAVVFVGGKFAFRLTSFSLPFP